MRPVSRISPKYYLPALIVLLYLWGSAICLVLGGLCLFYGVIMWIGHASAWVVATAFVLGVGLFSAGYRLIGRVFPS